MPKITYIEFDGTRHSVEVQAGITLMKAAQDNNVPGIDAECGGACVCATCRIHVNGEWLAVLGPAAGAELEMLEMAGDAGKNSRLGCQVNITERMDGLVLTLPETQR